MQKPLDNHTDIGVAMDPSRGPWLSLASGRKFFPLHPLAADVDLDDIAGALPKLCRYNGQCNEFYSVAQHSVTMAIVAEQAGWSLQDQKTCLMHDATEAYVGDMTRPLKSIMPEYRRIEDLIWCAIADRFDLLYQIPEHIKELDNKMISTEKPHMMPKAGIWPNLPDPLDIIIFPFLPLEAEIQFRKHCEYLGIT